MNFCESDEFDQLTTDMVIIMFRIRAASIAAVLLLTLTACGSDSASVESSTASGEAIAGPTIDGTFATVAGGQLDVGALEGQDTVLWFWAPW